MKSQRKMVDPRISEAVKDGRSATRISDNPYTKGTPAYREWKRGFAYASHVKNTTPKPEGNPLGTEAAQLGRDISSCPFEVGSKAYEAWMRSYQEEKQYQVQVEGAQAYKPDTGEVPNPYDGRDEYLSLLWKRSYGLAKSQWERFGQVYTPPRNTSYLDMRRFVTPYEWNDKSPDAKVLDIFEWKLT